jgi:hypothetical protein
MTSFFSATLAVLVSVPAAWQTVPLHPTAQGTRGGDLALHPTAQRARGGDPGLGVNLEPLIGREVRVIDAKGIERRGRLRAAGAVELRLIVPAGEVAVPYSDIKQMDRRDSLTNGVVIGMLWPAITLPLGGAQGLDSTDSLWAQIPLAMLVGGAIGAGIDALIKGWTPVYRSESPRRASFQIIPGRHGLRVSYVRRF